MESILLSIAIVIFAVALFAVAFMLRALWLFMDSMLTIAFEIKEDYHDVQAPNIK